MNKRIQPARVSILASLLAALVIAMPAAPVAAAPLAQTVNVEVSPVVVDIFPLGSARVQMVLSNPTGSEQAFVLEILLMRADGTIARAYLSDPVALAANYSVTAIYRIEHADGAVRAEVTPRSWPDLSS